MPVHFETYRKNFIQLVKRQLSRKIIIPVSALYVLQLRYNKVSGGEIRCESGVCCYACVLPEDLIDLRNFFINIVFIYLVT